MTAAAKRSRSDPRKKQTKPTRAAEPSLPAGGAPSPYDAELDRLPLNVSREVAQQISGLSQRTFDREIARNLVAPGTGIRSVKFGRRRLIPREELRRWLVAHLDVA
jgi:hypothetical protein